MTKIIATGLGVQVQQRPGQETYEFGVILDGVFIPMASRENGLVNDAITNQKAAKKAAASAPSQE